MKIQPRLNKEIEDYKLPNNSANDISRINNRLTQKESLIINENKIRDLVKKEFEKVNNMRAELTTDPELLLCYDDNNTLHPISYKDINSVVIEK